MSKRRTRGRTTGRSSWYCVATPGHHHAAATVRTGRRRGRSVGLVDSGRSPAARLPAVLRARAPTRTPATALGPVLGEGSCLSESCSPRCVELLFEALATALPPVPVALDSGQLLAQPFDLSFLFPNAGTAGILLGRRTLRRHHAVMPHPKIVQVQIFGSGRIRKLPR